MRLSGCDFFGCLSRSKKLFIRVPTALSSRKLATTPSHRRGKARLNNAIIHYRNLHQIESKRGPWHASAAARRRIMKMGSQAIDGAKLKANSHRKRRCSPLLFGIILLCKVAMISAEGPQSGAPYSQPLTTMAGQPRNDDTFRPILPIDISPEFISRNVFTKSGQYRVFQPAESESDLRLTVAMRRRNFKDSPKKEDAPKSSLASASNSSASIDAELKGLEDLLVDYVEQFFSQGKFEPTPGLVLALQQNHSQPLTQTGKRSARSILEDTNVELNVPRAFQSARLLFFSGKLKS